MTLTQAFPKEYQHKIFDFPISTSETTFTVHLNGEFLHIPVRIYNEELLSYQFEALDFQEKLMMSCLYTRHVDGFVRQKYAEILLAHVFDAAWVLPYIIKLAAEYVIEIVELIATHKARIPTLALRQFYLENEVFMQKSQQQMLSYWNAYYRKEIPNKAHYIGVKLFGYLAQVAKNPSYNMRALELFEQNNMDEAYQCFNKAVEQKRTVQALHNRAWMYVNEEERLDLAKPLLLEVVAQQPKHHFPYSLLGELYVKEREFDAAIPYLEQSLAIQSSQEAKQNIAVALFETGQYDKAACYFHEVAGNADLIRLNEIICYLRNGQIVKTKQLLDAFCKEAEDFVGFSELADVYVEIGEYGKAYHYFMTDWQEEMFSPHYLMTRIAFVMYRLQAFDELQSFIERGMEIVRGELEELTQEVYTEPVDIEYAQEMLEQYEQQLTELTTLQERLQEGFVPPFQFGVFATGGCQLYGCSRHGHPALDNGGGR